MSTDNAAPARSRRTTVIVSILVVLLLVLLAAFFGGKTWGDSRADDYAADYASWQKKDGAALLSETSALPADTYLMKDMHTKQNLAKQRKACAEVEDVAKRARKAGNIVPTVSGGPVGLVSSKLGDAADDSSRREKAVKEYATKAAEAYEQIHLDCTWNLMVNTPTKATKKATALYAKSASYLDPEGPMVGGRCNNKDGCISNVKSKRLKYADAREKAYRLDQRTWTRIYGAPCAKTSYGKKMCSIFRTSTKRYADVRLEQADVVRSISSSIDSQEIIDINAKWDKVQRLNALSAEKALRKLHPAAAKDAKVAKYPLFTDRFLRGEARRLLTGLAKDRAALDRL